MSGAGLLLDYSKHLLDDPARQSLLELCQQSDLSEWIEKQFNGVRINQTEDRAVLHTALRSATDCLEVEGRNVMDAIRAEQEKVRRFVEQVHGGNWLGYSGLKIRTVVNVGIGGSDLGPAMVTRALSHLHVDELDVRFVSNVDPAHLAEQLRHAEPQSTLFIIASKTFTTQETMANARAARQWLLNHFSDKAAVARHFVAVSTNTQAVTEFGISPDNMFQFWDWVGGRYSLWSVIGLSIALAVGYANFQKLLDGAAAMDEHFRYTPFEKNLPVLMALLGIWGVNFNDHTSLAVIPYAENLGLLPAYLQQAEMESNGKRVTRDGSVVQWHTCPVVWGEPGTNGQHAFFQLLHQGSQIIPVDFILVAKSPYQPDRQHQLLLANALAQSRALMQGRDTDSVEQRLVKAGKSPQEANALAPHRAYPGNRPSSSIVLPDLEPASLGALIALYEHKVFVQGVIWQICSFDQWGVELGKQVAREVESLLSRDEPPANGDASTLGLVNHIRKVST